MMILNTGAVRGVHILEQDNIINLKTNKIDTVKKKRYRVPFKYALLDQRISRLLKSNQRHRNSHVFAGHQQPKQNRQ